MAPDRGRRPAAAFKRGPSALQRTLDRGLARVEHLRDLGGAEAEHVAQYERRALAGRQVLKGDDECKLHSTPWPRSASGVPV